MFAVLTVIVCLGIVASSLTQNMSRTPEAHAAQLAEANPAIHAAIPQH